MKSRLKGPATVLAIMLVSVCGWIAVVALVIKPPFWAGALLSIFGGGIIGTVISYLIWRWWFQGDLASRMAKVIKGK